MVILLTRIKVNGSRKKVALFIALYTRRPDLFQKKKYCELKRANFFGMKNPTNQELTEKIQNNGK